MVTLTDAAIFEGKSVLWGLLAWKSRKHTRPSGSSMSGETMAMLKTLGRTEYALNMALDEELARDDKVPSSLWRMEKLCRNEFTIHGFICWVRIHDQFHLGVHHG